MSAPVDTSTMPPQLPHSYNPPPPTIIPNAGEYRIAMHARLPISSSWLY